MNLRLRSMSTLVYPRPCYLFAHSAATGDYVSADKFKETVAGTCPNGGARLTGGKFCPECGKPVEASVRFRPKCGAKQA